MKISIVGYGLEGQSSYEYYSQDETNQITICDLNSELLVPSNALTSLGEGYLANLDQYDLIVRSAGISPELILKENPNVKDKITTQINEFMRVSPTGHIIGVTGTKGKGTTSTLIANFLSCAGFSVSIGGNIGIPLLSILSKLTEDSYVVIETSSFQLIDFQGPSPHSAVCLMVVPEHLNWHKDLEEYYSAKANLFKYQSVKDQAIYFANNETSKQIAALSPGQLIPYYASPGAEVINGFISIDSQNIIATSEIKLIGEHNLQNICAAVTAVWPLMPSVEPIKQVLEEFTGLEHRLEHVRQYKGIDFYDDSFGTTPETAIVAIKAFSRPEVVILGGSEKGTVFDDLVEVIMNSKVKYAVLIGHTGKIMAELLKTNNFDDTKYKLLPISSTMAEILDEAVSHTVAGDIVLLSTGSASFDMFKDYKDRGNQFKAAVQALS